MKALVTGANGFLGSAVARQVLGESIETRVLVRPTSDRRNLNGLDVEIVEGDLKDRASLAAAVKGCTALFHVAADYRLWVPNPREIYENNVEGSRNIMLAAAEAGVERMIYTSSVATLGLNKNGSPADESTPVSVHDMIGHYKRSKFLAEKEVSHLFEKQDLPVIIVNPSTPVGPRDIKPTPTGRMIADAAAGRMPAYVDTGLNIAHVDDVAKGHLLALDRGTPGERYILGGENFTLKQIFLEIAIEANRKPPRVRLPHNAVMPVAYVVETVARLFRFKKEPIVTIDSVRMAKKHMYFSSAKAERELGYEHRPASGALCDAVRWFIKKGSSPQNG